MEIGRPALKELHLRANLICIRPLFFLACEVDRVGSFTSFLDFVFSSFSHSLKWNRYIQSSRGNTVPVPTTQTTNYRLQITKTSRSTITSSILREILIGCIMGCAGRYFMRGFTSFLDLHAGILQGLRCTYGGTLRDNGYEYGYTDLGISRMHACSTASRWML